MDVFTHHPAPPPLRVEVTAAKRISSRPLPVVTLPVPMLPSHHLSWEPSWASPYGKARIRTPVCAPRASGWETRGCPPPRSR